MACVTKEEFKRQISKTLYKILSVFEGVLAAFWLGPKAKLIFCSPRAPPPTTLCPTPHYPPPLYGTLMIYLLHIGLKNLSKLAGFCPSVKLLIEQVD